MAKSITVKNTGDFSKKKDTVLYIDKLTSNYETFLTNLDSFSDFEADHDTMFALKLLINNTEFLLYELLFEGKQERNYICERDTNLLLLSKKLYGSISEDNISLIKTTNNIGLSEILNIKQGREILYYV
jgi:hypothetical protein